MATFGLQEKMIYNSEARETVTGTTETSLAGVSVPANALADGARIRVHLAGTLDTDASPGTLTLRLKYGATNLVAVASGTLTASQTDAAVIAEFVATARVTGASGALISEGETRGGAAVAAQAVNTAVVAAPTNSAKVLTVSAQFSDAGNTLDVDLMSVEISPAP